MASMDLAEVVETLALLYRCRVRDSKLSVLERAGRYCQNRYKQAKA